MDNAWLHDLIQRLLQMILNINKIHFFPQRARSSKLRAINNLEVASLCFLEIDDLPNGFEVLRDHHSVKR
jgi:hypothetical protein